MAYNRCHNCGGYLNLNLGPPPRRRGRIYPEDWMRRRNPDADIRQLEREFELSGDRRVWLRIQIAKMRASQPYERTFIESQDVDDEVAEDPEMSDRLVETRLNNGWRVETWWDEHGYDFVGPPIGWTTIVTRPDKIANCDDEVGGALHCGDDADCARSCHDDRVNSIIDGSIEQSSELIYEDPLPLENTPPELRIQRHRCRGTDDDGRPLIPDKKTCGNCERSWCERCDSTPGPLCHFCHGRGHSEAELYD